MIKKITISEFINYLILLLILVIPLSYNIRDIIYGIIILLWIIEGNFKYKFNILKNYLDKVLILYFSLFILRFVSNLWSDSLYNGSYKGSENSILYCLEYDFFYLLIIPIIITSFKKEYIKKAFSVFIIGMFISEIASYGIIFGFWTTKYGNITNPTPFLHNHSFYSLFLAIIIFWLFKIVLDEKNRIKKFLYSIFILTATTNLFLNSGRTGQILFIILLFFSLIYFFKLNLKTILGFLFVSIMIVSIYYKISPNFQRRALQTVYSLKKIENKQFNTSLGGRMLAYFVVKDIAKKYPFGVGVGSAKKYLILESKKYGKANSNFFISQLPHAHNQFLQILLEIGFLGLIIFILFIIFLFKEIKNSEYSYSFYIFFIAYFFTLMIETWIRNKYVFILFNIFLAIFITSKSQSKVKNFL
jgi:O-antigen ligase